MGSLTVVSAPASERDERQLVERGAELRALTGALDAAAAGRGSVLVIEAAAGLGKTAVLDALGRMAERAGAETRHAAPVPFERHFPFGVVRALLEAPLRAASADERARLLDGPGRAAGRLLLGAGARDGDATTTIAASVVALCATLAAERPLVLVVDDAQWADRESLQVLSVLARRIETLPVVVAVAFREGDPDAPGHLLGSLLGATVLRPGPLTAWGAMALIRQHAPGASRHACQDCRDAAGGNPWLLEELGRQLATYGTAALGTAPDWGPRLSPVARAEIRARLATLPLRARTVAAALAVLGDHPSRAALASLAGVRVAELPSLLAALRAAGLLRAAAPGDALAHGLITAGILDTLPCAELDRLRREAARALAETGGSLAAAAAHLLRCDPQGDPDVSDLLARAAYEATRQGDPVAAARYLERAVQERVWDDERGSILARLGMAAFEAGLEDPRERLYESLEVLEDSACRVTVLTRLATLQALSGRDEELLERLQAEIAGSNDPDVREALEVAALDAIVALPDCHGDRERLFAALGDVRDHELARVVDAHRAWHASQLGSLSAPECAELALRALAGGTLLETAADRSAYHIAVRTLVASDRHEEAWEAIRAARAMGRARGSKPLLAAAARSAAELALRTGDLAGAERDARAALEFSGGGIDSVSGVALAVLVRALAERGDFDEAAELLRTHGMARAAGDRPDGAAGRSYWALCVRDARAWLWLATGDYERALEEANASGASIAHRCTAALALAYLGRLDEAAAVADAEIERAERFDAPTPLVIALHARALAERDSEARIALCRRALEVPGGETAVLARVRVRLELGATLSRAGVRVEARDELRPALEAAEQAGAMPLAERAQRELVASGVRVSAEAEALTPRQRQICELAAAGKGNREIANALFLSVKTVETHLAAGYRKLGVKSRSELAAALAA